MSERPGRVGIEADVEAVRAVSDAFIHAEMTGDVDAFAALLAEDAVIMAPWMPPLEGRAACMAFVSELLPKLFAEYDRKIQVETAELRILGDWAFERGIMAQTLTPRAGGEPVFERYNVLFIFSRDASGVWKGARTIFNLIEQSDGGDEAA